MGITANIQNDAASLYIAGCRSLFTSAPQFSLPVKNGQSNKGLCVRKRMGKLGSEVKDEKPAQTLQASSGRGSMQGN